MIAEVESGASRRAATKEFAVSAGTAVFGSSAFSRRAALRGQLRSGSISPLEKHADFAENPPIQSGRNML